MKFQIYFYVKLSDECSKKDFNVTHSSMDNLTHVYRANFKWKPGMKLSWTVRNEGGFVKHVMFDPPHKTMEVESEHWRSFEVTCDCSEEAGRTEEGKTLSICQSELRFDDHVIKNVSNEARVNITVAIYSKNGVDRRCSYIASSFQGLFVN